MTTQQTTILRVTPYRDTAVWRDIEIRSDQTLHDLHLAIQDAFELDNDHQYAFYLNQHLFDREFAYEGTPSAGRRSAGGATLGDLALPRNKRFLYLFDFGDEHCHHVKVISCGSVDAAATYPRIIASEGNAPPQYEEWTEEDEDIEEGIDEDVSPSAAIEGNVPGLISASDIADAWEGTDPASEEVLERLASMVPRIERAIERQQDLALEVDDVSESQTRVDLAGEFKLACELFDIAKEDARVMVDALEAATALSIWDWLCELPGQLSGVSMHEEALDLAQRVKTALGDEQIQLRLPGLLLRCDREQEARAVLAENLVEFPQDPLVQFEAAKLELAAGNVTQAESHFRDALKWVGTDMELRECILNGLMDLLLKTDQRAAILALRQREEAYLQAVFPRLRAETPVRRSGPKVGRNDPCPCGSGKKSKKCCGTAS